MRVLLVGLACFVGALAVNPTAPEGGAKFPPPPPLPVVRAVSLGRTYAASDLLWLRAVQLVGHPEAEQARYPYIDAWVDGITTLDPHFDYAYAFAAITLATDDTRLERIDTILARGEAAQPDSFWFPLQRGFVAYFGMLDNKRAAAHYRRAATKANAPPYLGSFARKLEETDQACAQMPSLLSTVMRAQSARDAEALRQRAVPIVEHCVQADWRKISAKSRLSGAPMTLAELVAAGKMPEPPAIPGLCWRQDDVGLPRLRPCEETP